MYLILNVIVLVFLLHQTNGQSPANNEQPFASILYTGVLKGKVALPCDVSAPSEDDSVALILWYKDDALAPIYTLDARKGSMDQARTLTSSLLEGRAYFNLHNRPAFLQIDPIKLEDAGDYRCRVDFKKARTVNTVISLKVIVPPEEPEIKSIDSKVLRGLVGPYAESSSLKLLCSTVGGKPRPSLTWWRDYTLMDDTFEYNDDVTTNTVVIPSLTRHHLLSVFTCQASNNNVTMPISTSITLDLNLKPSEVKITQLTPILVVNREARFQCSTVGARPQAFVYFLFNGVRKDVKLNCKPDSQCLSVLTMQITKKMNGASLRCVAENPRIAKSEITDQIKLDVQYAPQLNLKLGSATLSLQSIQEGNDIYFDCDIDANPNVIKPITWRFNDEIIQAQSGVIQSNQTLVLQSVSREQSGIYQCEVTNKQGTTLSNPIELKVKFAPVCQTEYIFVFGVSFHETVHLRCDVDSNPSEVSFHWKLHSSHQVDLVTYNQFNTSSILTYSPQIQQDYGVIECSAKNSVGIQQTPCYFQLVASGPPNFPFNCDLSNSSETSLTISCVYDNNFMLRTINQTNQIDAKDLKKELMAYKRAFYIFPITYYVCEIYHNNKLISSQNLTISNPPYTNSYLAESKEFKTFSQRKSKKTNRKNEKNSNRFKFLLTDLLPANEYEIKISAINRKGSSIPQHLIASTKKKSDRLFITKVAESNNHQNTEHDLVLKNGLPGLHWLSNNQNSSISLSYLLSLIFISFGIMIFILFLKQKYKRLMLMHSTLRNNQLNNVATSSSNCVSKIFTNKNPNLMKSNNFCNTETISNENFILEHSIGCCNVDYNEDALITQNARISAQLNQETFCEFNSGYHFNPYNQINQQSISSIAAIGHHSTLNIYEENHNSLNQTTLLTPPPSYTEATSSSTTTLPLAASNLNLKPYHLNLNKNLNYMNRNYQENHSLPHADYSNPFQSLNRKTIQNSKIDDFKPGNLIVALNNHLFNYKSDNEQDECINYHPKFSYSSYSLHKKGFDS